ncbi:MAG: aldehyde ferredoxin oxidoreductase family protein [Deltaproteobacteria bacterium]
MLTNDVLKNVLYINLSRKTFKIEERPELFAKYIGGAGIATQLLMEECPQGADPLGVDAPIIFAVGPLTALYPLASKTVAFFKSPHTGNLGESHCGGRSAVAIRMAGYGAIVIKGASNSPVYLSIQKGRVVFRDASLLWGLRTESTGRIIRENESGAGLRTIMRIGRGGENLVSYASVSTETYRHFGRLGLGAVFGAKKLKAIVVQGKMTLPVTDKKLYRKCYEEIYHQAVNSPIMKKYHDLGTAGNVLPLAEMGALPTRNLQSANFENAQDISGENFAEKFLGRRLACSHCPIGCIHIAALREPFIDEPYFYKTSMISYDYEPIYALGSMLGIGNPAHFLQLMDVVEACGIDAMSTGVILAWATETYQKGLISLKDTQNLLPAWGDATTYATMVKNIVEQPNDFYKALAKGVEYSANIYGNVDGALTFGKNEMPGYHTGAGAHIGVLAGMRHSHLDNAGYSIDQKYAQQLQDGVSPKEMARMIVEEESWRQILSSIVVCFFARGIYTPELVAKLLAISGFSFTSEQLMGVGKDIYLQKYLFKKREGFSFDELKIPKRILETPSPTGTISENYIREALVAIKNTLEA